MKTKFYLKKKKKKREHILLHVFSKIVVMG